jgi:hypothetical protein
MNDCPAEVWTRIFSFACTDGGKTGRSLTRVNSYFGQASQDVMLQSIEIRGAKQLQSFLSMLQKTPANARRVKHLYVSTYEIPQEDAIPPPEQMFEFLYGYGSYTQSYQKESREEPQPDEVCAMLLQVITILAPTLRSLHLGSLCRDHILLPITLPNLTDLSIHGPFPSWSIDDHTILPFPHLRRLSLSGFSDYPMNLFPSIRRLAPALSDLHLSPQNPTRVFRGDLQQALSVADDGNAGEQNDKLPASLTHIVVHPCEAPGEDKYWLTPVYLDMMAGLQQLSQQDTRVHLSKESSCDECW